MKHEAKVSMKIIAMQLAMDGRREGDTMAETYESGQAIYEWLIDDIPEDVPMSNVTNLRPV